MWVKQLRLITTHPLASQPDVRGTRKMERFARIRLVLSIMALAVAYYYLLIYLVGWTSAQPWPGWWFALFPSRRIVVISWMVILHTIAVLSAASPVAVASLLIDRTRALWVGAIAGAIATAASVLPSLAPTIWPLIWNGYPVLFVADQIKLVAAIPLLVWVIGKLSPNHRLEQTRGSTSLKHGGNR